MSVRNEGEICGPLLRIRARLGLLFPLNSGPHEIRSVDGVRAFAALITVAYHFFLFQHFYRSPLGQSLAPVVYFLQTGVHLFFVLSGFLLFLPYARAIIQQQPLPPLSRFYQRRALRILPAYWVCLTILALCGNIGNNVSDGGGLAVPDAIADVVTHIVLLHDAFPVFNRDIQGPFWTLAVESQFYVLLPLFAAAAAAYVGSAMKTPDRLRRLVVAVFGILGVSLLVRLLDVAITGQLAAMHGTLAAIGQAYVLATMGTQGKYLEVFAIGMLCSVLYVATVEMRLLAQVHLRRLSWLALAGAIAAAAVADQKINLAVPLVYVQGVSWDIVPLTVPLVVGIAYGLLLLATLWSDGLVRALFSLKPLRFIGLISYSLYLWHWPVLYAKVPLVAPIPIAGRVALVFLVAYASFQLVERPFLRRRSRITPAKERPKSVEFATPSP